MLEKYCKCDFKDDIDYGVFICQKRLFEGKKNENFTTLQIDKILCITGNPELALEPHPDFAMVFP